MSIQQVQKDYAAQLAVRLFDMGSNPVTGVPYTALTVSYKKQGGVWATKSVLVSDWVEGPDGRYTLLFSSVELDTEGRFTFRVSASGADIFTGDIDVVADWATVVDMLEALLNGLASKVSTQQIETYKQQQDEDLQDLDARYNRTLEQITVLKTQIATLTQKVAELP
jgi:hypothetical protein